jgi:hypothetical protein
MKKTSLIFVAHFILSSNLFAGGSSGGTPPAKTDELQNKVIDKSTLLN